MDTNGTGNTPQGIVSKSLAWALHPSFADTEPLDYFVFAVLLFLVGMLWSKVIRQTLEAVG